MKTQQTVILQLCCRVSITSIESLQRLFGSLASINDSHDERPDFSCWVLNEPEASELCCVVETLSFQTLQCEWLAWKACCNAVWLNSGLIGHRGLMVKTATPCGIKLTVMCNTYCRVLEMEMSRLILICIKGFAGLAWLKATVWIMLVDWICGQNIGVVRHFGEFITCRQIRYDAALVSFYVKYKAIKSAGG